MRTAVVVLALPLALRAATPTCLSAVGRPVAWWLAYKAPSGARYAFVDPTVPVPAGPLQLTGLQLDAPDGPLGATLTQLIAGRETLARVAWNDEPPAGAPRNAGTTAGTGGHSKGVLGGNGGGGFQLLHSLPAFPALNVTTFSFGAASTVYGQHFFCVTLDAVDLNAAAVGMQHADPLVYDSAVPASLLAALPALAELTAGVRKSGVFEGTLAARGSGALELRHFARPGALGLDMWADIVQPRLGGVDMWLETWRRSPQEATNCRSAGTGPGCPSCIGSTACLPCSGSHALDSMNVELVSFVTSSGAAVPFKYTQDHSKLALSAPPRNASAGGAAVAEAWVCAGDLNRMTSQFARGGEALCFVHAPAYAALAASIALADDCAEPRGGALGAAAPPLTGTLPTSSPWATALDAAPGAAPPATPVGVIVGAAVGAVLGALVCCALGFGLSRAYAYKVGRDPDAKFVVDSPMPIATSWRGGHAAVL